MKKYLILLIMSFLVLALSLSILFFEQIINIEVIDYGLIIWNFAAAIVIVVVATTVVKHRRKKKVKKEKPKKQVKVYSEPKEKYRTEYY